MRRLVRHAFAVAILPITAAVLVPAWLGRAFQVRPDLPRSMLEWLVSTLGFVALVAGGALFVACLRRFAGEGDGTLAPWDPPKHLVTRGPYAHVRNPMISGVLLVLLSEGLLLRSVPHVAWAGIFACLNGIYIPLVEEPGLRRRFGAEFEEYARHVPRLVPRLTAWHGSSGGNAAGST